MGDSTWDGTKGQQFVKIQGTTGTTEELECDANFNVISQDVECKVSSSAHIGNLSCIIWRTSTSDGWAFTKVRKENIMS